MRVSLLALLAPLALVAEPIKFNRDIRPIMADTCFRCHGPDKGSRMANLRLDVRDQAIKVTKSGVTPIVPGDPDHSAIIQRVFAVNAKIMPPKFAHKDLTTAQKETLRRWVAEGAQYEGHWAYEPIHRPEPPAVGSGNPIDAFVQERLRKEGLSPSAEADRHTLLRRVTLDLTGLPPTPAEMDAFLADRSPEAYRKVVDRLLASPRYAEQQAMHWLDAVRYADTAGFHGDNAFPAWPYRDYVLQAFRDNKPFDEFTREQLAGDLLPGATTMQKVASAFNRLNRVSAEGGLQPKEYLAKYGADRVRTIAATWLGATMGCAECHDHKFDPILSKDFYAMKAFFADVNEPGLAIDRGSKAWGDKLLVPDADQRRQLAELVKQIKQARETLDPDVDWEQEQLANAKMGSVPWRYQRPLSAASRNGATLTVYNDQLIDSNSYVRGSLVTRREPGNGLVVASGANPDNDTYTVRLRPGPGSWASLAVRVYQDEALPGNRLARGADRFLLTEVEAQADGQPVSLWLAASSSFGEVSENGPLGAIDHDPATGWGVSFGEARNPMLSMVFAKPLNTNARTILTVRLHQDSALRKATMGRFRLALSPEVTWPDDGVPTALAIDADERTDEQQAVVRQFYAWSDSKLRAPGKRLAELEYRRALLEAAIPRVMVTRAVTPRETRILPRADWMNETAPIVQPAIPVFLGKLDTGGRRASRLDLANWLVAPDNPLTARVFVNRQWRQLFGTGLSKVLDDFGSQGEWPTHPELLDWLASELMHPQYEAEDAHPWDIKHVLRTIVMSETYRQSSRSTPQLDQRDPENRLLARQSSFRVEAENVRDVALAVSGLLTEHWGGPPVKPYQPPGYYAALNFPKREYSASRGDDLYRRGLYTHWQRSFLHPSLLAFDAPTREECTVNRTVSNTPLQALDLLNDPIFVEAARVFAQNVLLHGGHTWQDQLTYAYQRALGRPPLPEERRILTTLYLKDQQLYRQSPAAARQLVSVGEAPRPETLPPAELAAMTTVTRTILNLHETVTRD